MTQYKQNFELKNAAKDKLDGKYTGAVLILVLSSLISNSVTLFIDSIGSATLDTVRQLSGFGAAYVMILVVFNILLVLANIICTVMEVGITLYFLNIACSRPLSVRDLFYGFQNDPKKSLVIATAIVPAQNQGPEMALICRSRTCHRALHLCHRIPWHLSVLLSAARLSAEFRKENPCPLLAYHARTAPQALFAGAEFFAPDAPVHPELWHRFSLAGTLYADDLHIFFSGYDESTS